MLECQHADGSVSPSQRGVADYLVELQGKNGAWTLEMEGFDPTIDVTAEMVVWLDEIYQAVGEV